MIAAIEAGYPQREIERQAFAYQRAVESGTRVVVGQNRFREAPAAPGAMSPGGELSLHHLDAGVEQAQRERLASVRASRDATQVAAALAAVEDTARGPGNLVPAILRAVVSRATLGEISHSLRRVFGTYHPAR